MNVAAVDLALLFAQLSRRHDELAEQLAAITEELARCRRELRKALAAGRRSLV